VSVTQSLNRPLRLGMKQIMANDIFDSMGRYHLSCKQYLMSHPIDTYSSYRKKDVFWTEAQAQLLFTEDFLWSRCQKLIWKIVQVLLNSDVLYVSELTNHLKSDKFFKPSDASESRNYTHYNFKTMLHFAAWVSSLPVHIYLMKTHKVFYITTKEGEQDSWIICLEDEVKQIRRDDMKEIERQEIGDRRRFCDPAKYPEAFEMVKKPSRLVLMDDPVDYRRAVYDRNLREVDDVLCDGNLQFRTREFNHLIQEATNSFSVKNSLVKSDGEYDKIYVSYVHESAFTCSNKSCGTFIGFASSICLNKDCLQIFYTLVLPYLYG